MGKDSSGNKPIKVKTTDKASESVKKLFEDKRIATQDEFEASGKKTEGFSSGYQAKRKTDKHTFMIKKAFKRNEFIDQNDKSKNAKSQEKIDLATEYVMGPLYQRVLYDRAPVVELVLESGAQKFREGLETIQHSVDGQNIYIRSKFFDSFEMLGHYTGNQQAKGNVMNTDQEAKENIAKLVGFEKVITACLFMGENDYHAGNLGVVKSLDERGEEHFTAVKIDHGRSYIRYKNELDIRTMLSLNYKQFKYQGLMPLNAKEMLDSINSMLEVQDEEIENIVLSRVRDMNKVGFEFTDYQRDRPQTDKRWASETIERIKGNKRALADFGKSLEMITASNLPEQIKGDVMKALGPIGKKDVVLWMRDENHKVGDIDPVLWAAKNGMKIEGVDPVLWMSKQGMQIESKDPIKWAIDNKKQIEGKPAAEWVVDDLLKQYIVAKENNDTTKMGELESKHKSIVSGDKDEINDVNSDLGKMLASGKNYKKIARVIEKVCLKMAKDSESSNALEAVDLKCSSSLEFLYHASKIGEELARREQVRGKISLSHALQSFCDLISNIFGKKIPENVMTQAKKDLGIFVKEAKEGKFTEKLAEQNSQSRVRD